MKTLIDNVLSETICLFCFSALFSNICRKINFMAKNGFDLCNFYGKLDFLKKFFIRNFIRVYLTVMGLLSNQLV